MVTHRVEHYVTPTGVDVFGEWLEALNDVTSQARVATRIDRLTLGLLGDAKALRDGVSELRIDHGPGYRVYFARDGRTVILLLCGGDKRTQRSDIKRAVAYWNEYRGRK